MNKFKFSSGSDEKCPIFSGVEFYDVYKNAHFLKNPNNIATILSKGYELRRMLKSVSPGQVVALQEMVVYENAPILVKKTGPKVEIKKNEFTANRLSGLTAAYAFENRLKLDNIKSSDAESLGLVWDGINTAKCRLYLSAVSGTEHFYGQFQYWPLVCALRKLQMKKINLESVVKIANVKSPSGIRLAGDFIKNIETVKTMWIVFPNANVNELQKLMVDSGKELLNLFRSYT